MNAWTVLLAVVIGALSLVSAGIMIGAAGRGVVQGARFLVEDMERERAETERAA